MGYTIEKAILFGSYAKGNPRHESDVDLAIWDRSFSGLRSIDLLPMLAFLRNYPKLKVHFYNLTKPDPFEEEIISSGIEIKMYTV